MKLLKKSQEYLNKNFKEFTESCCGQMSFEYGCCGSKEEWKAFLKDETGFIKDITHKLQHKHIDILEIFRKTDRVNLKNKVIEQVCCENKKVFLLKKKGTGSISGFIWNDLNKDGIKDPGEVGVSGVLLQLKENGNVVEAAITSNDGLYSFKNLNEGVYEISIVPPEEYVLTLSNQGGDDTKDSDAILTAVPGTFVIPGINLAPGQHIVDADGGVFLGLTASGNVWNDINRMSDGYVNNTAPLVSPLVPIPSGLKVYLMNDPLSIIEKRVDVNPATGTFTFSGLLENTDYYAVLTSKVLQVGTLFSTTATLPSGWVHTGQNWSGVSPTGHDGLNDGVLYFSVGTQDESNINFGINQFRPGDIALG